MADDCLAQRLNRLFAAVHAPGSGRPYSAAEVIDGITSRGGSISAGYLSQLRSGRRHHLSTRVAGQIAEFFGVDPAYLLGTDPEYCAEVDKELTLMIVTHEPTLRTLIESIVALPPEHQDVILDFADRIRADRPNASASRPIT